MGGVLDCIEPNQLAALIPLFAIALSEGLDSDEVNALGTFIAAVGSTMQSIAAQQQLLSSNGE